MNEPSKENLKQKKSVWFTRLLIFLGAIILIAAGFAIMNFGYLFGFTVSQGKIIAFNLDYICVTIYFVATNPIFLKSKKLAFVFTAFYLILGSVLLQGIVFFHVFSEPMVGNTFHGFFTIGLWVVTNKLIEKTVDYLTKNKPHP